ncbi:substrate-binding domain-containing protein [Streptomyces sp. NPDC051997]|uniref:substrate-binding domain-containing protein n=1 Tax=Streptomyces sp. NPDC051997 TaxID=3155611 RepID=UPI00342B6A16
MCILRDCVANRLAFPDVILLQRFLGLLTLLRPHWNEQALQAAASSFAEVLSEDQPALGRCLLILWQVRCGIWNVVPDDCRAQWPQHYFEHLVLSACRTFRWPSPDSPERVQVSAAAAGVASEFLAPDDLLRHWSDEDRKTAARVLGQFGSDDAVTERLLKEPAGTTGPRAPRGKGPKRSPAWTLREAPHTVGQESGDVRAADDPAPGRGPREMPPPSSPRRGLKIALAVVAVIGTAAVVFTLVRPGTDPPKPPALPTCTQPHPEAIHLAASSDLYGQLDQDAKDYKAHRSGSHCFSITVDKQNSGTTMRALAGGWPAGGKPQPDIWSPAGTIWLRLARQEATATTRKLFPDRDPQPIVTSPLVIAMPEPMAQNLERSDKNIGWRTLADAARHSTTFWASHKRPEWGEFKLGKTNPDYSTSGLNATLATAAAATGSSTGLTSQDVTSPAAKSLMGDTESAVVHYGDTTLAFLQNLRRADDATTPANPDAALHYISAVTVEEQAVVAYNMGYPCGTFSTERGCKKRPTRPHTPLVAIYPSDGILYSDHPFVELTTMSKEKKAVADGFAAYLRTAKVQKKFNPLGFRTWDNRPTPWLKPANGALSNPPIKRLPPPEPAALGTLLDVWPKLRKRAHVSVLIDTSGSMGEHVTDPGSPSKMELLKQAAPELFGPSGFADNDQVGLWEFSDSDKNNVPMGPMSGDWNGVPRRKALSAAFANLRPDGRTALYQCVGDAVDQLRAHYDPSAINAVVVLTDGRNDPKDIKGLDTLLASLSDHRKPVRVFTIAYGNGSDEQVTADKTVLEDIADKSDAHPYDAKDHPADIADILANVISNF